MRPERMTLEEITGMSGKKRKKQQHHSEEQRKVYSYSPLPALVASALIFVVWVVALLLSQAELGRNLVIGLTVFTVVVFLWIVRFGVGKIILDDKSVAVRRPLGSCKFKWSELGQIAGEDGFHAPSDHDVPGRTSITRASGGTAFAFSHWVRHYEKLREDLRQHLRDHGPK